MQEESMFNSPVRHRHRIVAVGIFAVTLLVTTAVLLLVGSSHDPAGRPAPAPMSTPSSPQARPSTPVAHGSDPRAFAIKAAEAVFEWDTTTSTNTDGYYARLVEIADPGGVESDGLVADLSTYLPTDDAWRHLRTYKTRQWLAVTSARVPSTWTATAREGEAYGLERGTTAYTIDGVRHRTGIWNGKAVHSRHDVSFTVFIICGPRYPTCYLLRLSQPNHPLQ